MRKSLAVLGLLLALGSQQAGCGGGGSTDSGGAAGAAGTSGTSARDGGGLGGAAAGAAGGGPSAGAAGQATGGAAPGGAGGGGRSGGSGGGAGQVGTGGAAGAAGVAGGAGAGGAGGGGRGGAAGGRAGAGGNSGTLQVLPLGDSITFGYDGTNAGYRGPLFELLEPYAPGMLYVGSSLQGSVTTKTNPLPSSQRHNEGHSSYTIDDISHNLDGLDTTEYDTYGGADRNPNGGHWLDGIASGANARAALYPDVILMMIGTNDASATDRTAVRSRLHALITKITTLRPGAKLLVAQITPSNRPNNVSYNADVAGEVKSFQAAGKSVSVVDMYTNFPSDGLSSDHVHPNDKGFAFMARQWLSGILAAMPGLASP